MRQLRRLAALALAVALLAGPSATAAADLEDDLASVLSQIEDLEERLDDAAAQRSGIVGDILATRDRLAAAGAELAEAESALREVRVARRGTEAELDTTQQQVAAGYEAIAQTRQRIAENRTAAQDWVLSQYMRHSESAAAAAVFGADKVADIGSALFILETLSARASAAVDRHEALGAEEQRQQVRIEERERYLGHLAEELASAERRQADLTAAAEALNAVVADELAVQQRLLRELDTIVANFETELDGLEAEQGRLEELIRNSSGGGGAAPGQLVRPVPGPITSPFGPRLHPILGYTRMHTGVDMTAPLGQDIKAGAAGTVIVAETYGGYGLTVIVDHGGGMTTLYAHQSRLFVRRGDKVGAGDVVGEAGATGLATGPHLHFEVRLDGTPVDPAGYL